MDVYMYQADLYCAECVEKIKADLEKHNSLHWPATQTDSDSYPQGPYPDGGDEADRPQHCAHCGCFLENPITSDGYAYVQTELTELLRSSPVGEWFDCYSFSIKSSESG